MRHARTSATSFPGFTRVILAAFLIAVAVGCAGKGPILIEGVEYKAPEGLTAGQANTIVAVSPFRDMRESKASVIGQRKIRDAVSNDLVVQGNAADMVDGAIRASLKARGIQSRNAAAWDLNEASIKAENSDILVGGEIKALWIDVISEPLSVNYKAVVQLRVSTADVKDGKVLRTLNLSSSQERKDVVYSDYTVQDVLVAALSSAIDQLLNDEEFKKNIH